MTARTRVCWCWAALAVFGLSAAGPVGAAWAQEEEHPVFEAEPMVVVATGEPAAPGTLPAAISVITRAEIERSGAQNLMDLLVREPGVWVARQGGMGFGGNVSVRGFGGSPPTQVQVLVDGHPSQMGIMGHILPTSYLLHNVERVEILRGPSGAMHGHMALGGVINIVTRAAADERARGSAQGAAGSFGTRGLQLWAAGAKEEGGWRLQAGRLATDGDHAFARYDADNYSVALDHRIGEQWSAAFRAQQVVYQTLDQREVANAYAQGREPASLEQDFDRRDYDLAFTHRGGARSSTVRLYRTDGEHRFGDGFHSRDYGQGLMVSQRAPVGEGRGAWGVTVGEYGGDILSPSGLQGTFSRRERAAHVTLEHPAGDGAQLSGGLRYTRPEGFGGEWLPSAGYHRPLEGDWSLFASVRRGYRVPSFRELYLFGVNNPGLAPESVWQYEVGARRELPGGGQLEVALFRIRAKDLIVLAPRPPEAMPGTLTMWQNVGRATRDGLEVSVRRPVGPRAAVYGSYSHLDPGEVKVYTVGRKLVAGLDYRVEEWTLSGDLQWAARLFGLDQTNTLVKVPSFVVVNLKASRPLAGGARAALVVENVFDREYRVDPAYPYPMPGRALRLMLEHAW